MAVDVQKLIDDARAAQAAARTASKNAQAQAAKDRVSAEVTARSKKELEYANTLRPRLKNYEETLKITANKIARGDKLSSIEQKEFDRLVKEYKSLSKTIDSAIKKSNDILVEERRRISGAPTPRPELSRGPSGPTGPAVSSPSQTQTPIQQTPASEVVPEVKTPPAKTPAKTPVKKPAVDEEPTVDREAEALNAAAGTDFALPETLFKNIPSLNALLKKYVNTPGMTPDAFRKMLRNDVWYKKNSQEIKERFVQYYNYRDLQASGQAQGTTDYEMQIAKIEASLKKRAVQIGSAAASDPAALRKAAENLYITNRSEDQSFIDDFLAASIRPVAGMIGGKGTEGYSGQALSNYQTLLSTARDNGLKISDIIPGGANEQQVLQGIASGKLDINRIIQDARKLAAQGQPQYVRDLLSQGYNLNQVFAPYRQTMAAVLEIDDPNSIDLNDPLLRSAISDKGDMNVYEFKKALRKDSRWQYTEQARQDVSSATLDILRDFGFQG
jgi:hypothetical protein